MGERKLEKALRIGPTMDFIVRPGVNDSKQSAGMGTAGATLAYYTDRFVLKGSLLLGLESNYDYQQTGEMRTCHSKYEGDYDCPSYDGGKNGSFGYGGRVQVGYLFSQGGEVSFHAGLGADYLVMNESEYKASGSLKNVYLYGEIDTLLYESALLGIKVLIGNSFESRSGGISYSNIFFGAGVDVLF